MALATRLLGRRRLIPPPLAGAVAQISAPTQRPSNDQQHRIPPPASTLPFPTRELPFAAPARTFSWYSRSSPSPSPSPNPGPGPDARGILSDDAYADKESNYLGGVHIVDDGDEAAGATIAAGDAVGEVTAEGVQGVSDLATSTVVDLIDGLHAITGLPWWLTISLSTVAMRLMILPVLALQLQKIAKIGELSRQLPPPLPGRSLRDQYTVFRKKRKELGCPSFLWNFAYFSVQFPCFILWMMSIRGMCLTNHPGFDNGGILWFQNLTETPHGASGLAFPILVAGLHYLNVQISFKGSQIKHYPGIFGLLAKYYKIYLDILAVPLFLIAYVVPQGSLVYWTTNGLFSVAQQLSFRNDVIRKMLGLPTRAHLDYRAQKSPLQNPKMMQNLQQSQLGHADMQKKLTLSDNGAADENTPNFMFESNNIIEGNISDSSSPEELLEQALQYFGAGHRDQAVPLIRTAIEKNPDLSTALIGMGQTLFSNRLFAEAGECFEHAVPKIQEHDPLLLLAYFGAGISHERQGDIGMAIKHLQKLADLKEPEKPINKQCYFSGVVLLGSILSKEGRNSEAAKYLRMAITYDPSVERLLKECEEGVDNQTKSEEQ